jgi:phosphate transport system substrate-binding protein
MKDERFLKVAKARKNLPALLFVSSFILLLSAFTSACRATPTPTAPAHFRIGTADSTQYIAREAAAAYRVEHPNTTFDFFKTNSTMSLRQLAFGQYDFSFVERNPRADELERANATAYELGRDGIIVLAHPSNALQNLSREELKKIMSGEINRWSQLNLDPPGGQDSIQVLAREDGSGMRAVMEEQIMQGARTTPTALLQPTNLDMLDYVAEHPNAIGYVAANIWDNNTHTRALAIEGIAPTRENIANGTYPLLQTVFLIVPKNASADVAGFVDFLASNEGRATIYRRLSAPPRK